jgi:hypothetical protein
MAPSPWRLPAAVLPKAAAVPAGPVAGRARFFRSSLVDIERPAIEFTPVESGNRTLSFSVVTHLHEPESTGPSGFPVRHNAYPVNCPVRLEHRSKGIFRGAKAEVSYKYILQVILLLLLSEIHRAANEGRG